MRYYLSHYACFHLSIYQFIKIIPLTQNLKNEKSHQNTPLITKLAI